MSTRASYILGLCCALCACSFDDRVKHCTNDAECGSGECYRGYCIEEGADAPDAGGGSADEPSTPSSSGGKVGSTSNASKAAGAGARAAGSGGAMGGASGRAGAAAPAAGSGATPVPPGPGQTASGECTDGVERPCLVAAARPTVSEACIRGMQRCTGKAWGGCIGEPMPAIEQCNGVDDDCDNKLDEGIEVECYPDAQTGCTKQSDGWSCQGLCTFGKQACTQGKLGECAGFKIPAMEACTAAGMQAADENCNGMTDESCACMPGETRSCYSGREGTLGVGKCAAGTQTCGSNGVLGACTNAVTHGTETCANQGADDDCDGKADNIPNLGGECVSANASGPCRSGKYQCEAGKAELSCISASTPGKEACNNLDDDCNGKVDDTFDLMTDAKNCGACGKMCSGDQACCGGSCVAPKGDVNNCGGCGVKCAAGATCNGGKCKDVEPPPPPPTDAGTPPGTCQPKCGAGQTCCDGSCVDTKTDIKHCGACGNACTGSQPGCCNDKCVDLVSNGNCGQCGRDCSLLTNGGLTCTCTKAGDGSIACTGPVLNVCL